MALHEHCLLPSIRTDCRIGGFETKYLAAAGEPNLVRVPDEIKKSVGFIVYDDPREGRIFAGTAFFLGLPIDTPEQPASRPGWLYSYLVTAKHVIEGIKEKGIDHLFLRVNDKAGGFQLIRIDLDKWVSHADPAVDVAVVEWPIRRDLDVRLFPLNRAATDEVIEREEIGIGDETFLVGLYTKFEGKSRNIPIVRVGNIAAMPDEAVTTKHGEMQCYLVEIRSIGGISGSPVFAHLRRMMWDGNSMSLGSVHFLLGLMYGRWDMKHLAPIMHEIDSDYLKQPLNSGISIVVPVARISEALDLPVFAESRARQLARIKHLKLPTTD